MTKLARRARAAFNWIRREAGDLKPPAWTALRVPKDRQIPHRAEFARFGEQSWIGPPAEIVGAPAIEIGDGVTVMGMAAFLVDADHGARLTIGDRTRLARGVHIACSASIEIGQEVSSSDFATITDSWALFTGPVRTVPPPPPAPVVVERGAYLGFGSIVGPGVRVGEGAFVGEQAVVLNDVAPHSVVYGNPATEVRRYEAVTGEWIGPRFP